MEDQNEEMSGHGNLGHEQTRAQCRIEEKAISALRDQMFAVLKQHDDAFHGGKTCEENALELVTYLAVNLGLGVQNLYIIGQGIAAHEERIAEAAAKKIKDIIANN